MMVSLFLALLTFSCTVFAESTGRIDRNTKACTRELEGIVYNPSNCGFLYLERITNILRIQAPLFWADPSYSRSAFESFEAAYGVTVEAITPLGESYPYIGAPADELISATNMGHSLARSNLDGNGFSLGSDNHYYTTIFWGRDGQMSYIQVTLPNTKVPIGC